jgi:hypothetical protein
MEEQKCDHEVDWASAGLAGRFDEACDVGVECRKCGEQGFALVDARMVKWNDED